jgi:Zn-dependent protease with chaperone function
MSKSIKAKRYQKDSKTADLVIIVADEQGLSIECNDEKQSIDYSLLEIQPAAHMEKLTILHNRSDGTTFICDDKRLLPALSAVGNDNFQEMVRHRMEDDRGNMRVLIGWVGVFAAIVLTIFLVANSADVVAGWASNKVPPQADAQIGDVMFNEYRQSHKLEPASSPNVRRVRQIGQRLSRQLVGTPYEFNFWVEPADQINAFAFPGGNIVVYSKLVDQADSNDEIAGVLGHEIGHVIHRHHLRHLIYSGGTAVTLDLLFNGGGRYAEFLQKYLELDRLRYGRSEEADADKTGVRLAVEGDYNPNGIISFHKKIARLYPQLNNPLAAFQSDHPMPDERIADIEKDIAQLKAEHKIGTAR